MQIARKPTMSKDGKPRYTVTIPFRVEPATVEWVKARLGCSTKAALERIARDMVAYGSEDSRVYAWDAQGKRLTYILGDDIENYEDMGQEIYNP